MSGKTGELVQLTLALREIISLFLATGRERHMTAGGRAEQSGF